jgi:protein-L-isoaspartate(D-aspartate) O-methyltransferase
MDFAAARRTMIATQVKTAAVTDPLVVSALEAVPREEFVPANQRAFAYMDEDLPVGKGRYAMEPAVLARLLQLADVQPEDRALVVAAGTGYTAAVLAQMAQTVVAVDADAALAEQARAACRTVGAAVTTVVGDPKNGCPEHGPYDVIVIDGAVAEIPASLEERLRDGGRLVAVVRRDGIGRATQVTRVGNAFSRRESFDAMTPLLPEFAIAPKFVF